MTVQLFEPFLFYCVNETAGADEQWDRARTSTSHDAVRTATVVSRPGQPERQDQSRSKGQLLLRAVRRLGPKE
ncbi:hypothetical protein VFPFJ_02367 [Purpureocillium lilacinum]|uniref:Uncharacterized protein n=1 Tax=Purpureocillium lilacinum TaxID=33203 RepID=A0A179GNT7_PURLI|nr:hypothetical protein VFPFJ_02367 [Purpureocillium lilacinum]OAQ79040.1 hypothetical protein VFPBJ_07161 [Purpureocillium lilacinum]OAQ93206.1 hypothetical protein VFPFJ_02367 [Purpureocillium lilacinum]